MFTCHNMFVYKKHAFVLSSLKLCSRWSCKFIWHVVAILCSYYCVSIRWLSWSYWSFIWMKLMRCNNDHNPKNKRGFYYFWCCMLLHFEQNQLYEGKWYLLTLRSEITYVGVRFSSSTYFQDNYHQLPYKIRCLNKLFVSQHFILNKLSSFSDDLML